MHYQQMDLEILAGFKPNFLTVICSSKFYSVKFAILNINMFLCLIIS